ncbi:hypothetical protein [Deinococcus actinosclerus]|nr:hypothetical protein [Deinococcus actinosclerus]
MTAKDSKSTPKKAEDATRHPLALLADRPQRAESSYSAAKFGECQGCGGRSGSLDAEGICGVCHDAAYLAEWQAYAEQLESALRAQAEAWGVVEAIATAEPPIGAQEARIFAQKALALAQAGAGSEGGEVQ